MEIKMNFTGKNKLSDEEFIQYYERLWNATPHYLINWPIQTQIEENKRIGQNTYNNSLEKLSNEEWDFLPGNKKYLISTKGRVKYEVENGRYRLIEQDDKYPNRPGYLVLSPQSEYCKLRINKTTEVYTFVAMTFLGKEAGDGFQVHHIHNNGYDCSTEELILLTVRQHKAVHLDQKLNPAELIDFLKDRYNEDRIKNHLANYKLNTLNIEECGIWKRNNKKYSHILPEELKDQNLIQISYQKEFKKLFENYKTSLHKDFAHLNSSQALCFNLFYPLSLKHRLLLIDKSISEEADVQFEYEERDSFEKKEKTNFDFFINDKNQKYFFEIKYTEQTFGYVSAFKPDDRHDQKYKDYYKLQLKKIAEEDISEKEFFDNYQIWRNICHSDKGIVYFVFLRTREPLEKELKQVIGKCKEEYQKKIRILYIEDLVQSCLKIKDDDKFYKHYSEFYKKYLKNI